MRFLHAIGIGFTLSLVLAGALLAQSEGDAGGGDTATSGQAADLNGNGTPPGATTNANAVPGATNASSAPAANANANGNGNTNAPFVLPTVAPVAWSGVPDAARRATLLHMGQTITVGISTLPEHLAEGDQVTGYEDKYGNPLRSATAANTNGPTGAAAIVGYGITPEGR